MMSIVIAGTKRTKAMQTRRPVSGRNESWSIVTKKNKAIEKNKRDEMVIVIIVIVVGEYM